MNSLYVGQYLLAQDYWIQAFDGLLAPTWIYKTHAHTCMLTRSSWLSLTHVCSPHL
jgi:hypothetical protein